MSTTDDTDETEIPASEARDKPVIDLVRPFDDQEHSPGQRLHVFRQYPGDNLSIAEENVHPEKLHDVDAHHVTYMHEVILTTADAVWLRRILIDHYDSDDVEAVRGRLYPDEVDLLRALAESLERTYLSDKQRGGLEVLKRIVGKA